VLVATDGTLTLGLWPSDITNAGTIEVADGGTLIVTACSAKRQRKLIIDPGGTFEYNGWLRSGEHQLPEHSGTGNADTDGWGDHTRFR